MIDIVNLSIQFAGSYLFEDVNLKILPNDKIALVGSNGTGKSTLLKILARQQAPEDGNIHHKKGLKIGFLPQELIPNNSNTIFNEVRNSIEILNIIENEEAEITKSLQNENLSEAEHEVLIEKLGSISNKKELIDYYEIDSKIEKILMGLGFSPDSFNRPTSELSGGWQMRIELAKILISENDIILLDEPTNHLDLDSLRWLVKFLSNNKSAIILVSHDRYFVNKICNKTLEIFNNDVTFYRGNYNDYLNFKSERAERLKLEFQNQQKKIKQTEQFIERFRYKATKAKQVQSRVKQLDKIDRVQLLNTEQKIHFKFFDSVPSGVIPLRVKNLTKSYQHNLVLDGINLQIERGDKIALVGPNGAGKTTFAKILSQQLQPSSGNVELGHNTFVSFYAQDVVDNLNIENDIITEIAESDSENTTMQLRTILGAFLFHGDEVFKKISVLSGGEKSRVALAKVLLTKANTIILDEPTNHLDFDSKKIVQDALKRFAGTLIIVSHDIDFLKPIVSKVIEVRNNNIKEYVGGIDYYLSKLEEVDLKEDTKEARIELPKKLNRKDEKRQQAEKRQEEYTATKNLKENISRLESKIEVLENDKIRLESEFAKQEVFSNPELAKLNKVEYEEVRTNLDKVYHEWTELNDELEKIMKKFS